MTWRTPSRILAVALSAALAAPPAGAVDLSLGPIQGSLDTTIAIGANLRVADPSRTLIGVANGGTARSTNGDDGTRNYAPWKLSALAANVTHDLELDWGALGSFVRVNYFYDSVNVNGTREVKPLTKEARELTGTNVRVLDAYVRAHGSPLGMPSELRLGRQVVSWGESTFIQNSINAFNPVDVAKLRVPGSRLEEALLPVAAARGTVSLTDRLSVEGLYQAEWERTVIDPPRSYFSTNDFAGEGGTHAMLGFGTVPEAACPAAAAACVPRTVGRDASNDGQYGGALRYLVPWLDTEVGLYYLKYHSRVPVLSALAVTSVGVGGTGFYFTEYPEDIELFGASFNFDLLNTGVAVQGEYSMRKDVPLQVDDVELLVNALRLPFSQLGAAPAAGAYVPGFRRLDVNQAQMTLTYSPTRNTPLLGAVVRGLDADQWVLVGEAGATMVPDLPDESVLRFEGPGTHLPGGATAAGALSGGARQLDGFATDFSWGYRLVTRMDFLNAMGPVNVSPRLAFSHDVSGVSPGPGGNFVEGVKALTLGVTGDYQNSVSLDLSYTDFFGGGPANLIHDRDFVGLLLRYAI